MKPFCVTFLALAISVIAVAAHSQEKPLVVITRFDVSPPGTDKDSLAKRLPDEIADRLKRLGKVTPSVITPSDIELFRDVAGQAMAKARYTVSGRLQFDERKVKVTVELEERHASGDKTVKVWDVMRKNDIGVPHWARRVAEGIHERITQNVLPKSVFIHCFDTLDEAVKDYGWRIPTHLVITIGGALPSNMAMIRTHTVDVIHGECGNFQPTTGSLTEFTNGMIEKYDFVLGGTIMSAGELIEVPIILRSTVQPDQVELLGGGGVKEKKEFEPIVRKIADHFRENWLKVKFQ